MTNNKLFAILILTAVSGVAKENATSAPVFNTGKDKIVRSRKVTTTTKVADGKTESTTVVIEEMSDESSASLKHDEKLADTHRKEVVGVAKANRPAGCGWFGCTVPYGYASYGGGSYSGSRICTVNCKPAGPPARVGPNYY